MTAGILDGKQTAEKLKANIKQQLDRFIAAGKRVPGLAVVLVGEDPASQIYVKKKVASCEAVGMKSYFHRLAATISQTEIMDLITQLNHDPHVDGILVQLPLPKHLDSNLILDSILPEKDVDGFHPHNLGLLAQKRPRLRSCTPYGIIQLLNAYSIPLRGLDAVVVGASNIVGRPMALELLLAACTVTVCHSATRSLQEHVRCADLVVAAVGKPHFIPGAWIKRGAIVVDVGINRLEDGRLAGDVEFAVAQQHGSWITPVPGGVGPMTVATLLSNTVQAYQWRIANCTQNA